MPANHQLVRMHHHYARLLQARAGNINSTQGLTPAGACIEIASSFVILDGAKKNITGPGGTTPTGIGIWVHHNLNTDFLGFRGTVISGWDVGLLIEGKANRRRRCHNEYQRARQAWSCTRPAAVELTNTTAENNLNYGIWLKQTSYSDVSNSNTQSNGNIGLYVGCSDIGPISAGCTGVGASSGNYIFTGNILANTNYGVALDIGAMNSIVTNQTPGGGTHNSKDDLFDANSSCGSNKWFGNASTATNNQPGGCIK